jgi:hypothetical protein
LKACVPGARLGTVSGTGVGNGRLRQPDAVRGARRFGRSNRTDGDSDNKQMEKNVSHRIASRHFDVAPLAHVRMKACADAGKAQA